METAQQISLQSGNLELIYYRRGKFERVTFDYDNIAKKNDSRKTERRFWKLRESS